MAAGVHGPVGPLVPPLVEMEPSAELGSATHQHLRMEGTAVRGMRGKHKPAIWLNAQVTPIDSYYTPFIVPIGTTPLL